MTNISVFFSIDLMNKIRIVDLNEALDSCVPAPWVELIEASEIGTLQARTYLVEVANAASSHVEARNAISRYF